MSYRAGIGPKWKLFKFLWPLIIFSIPVNNSHIKSSFFCDKMVIFAIFGPKILTCVAYISRRNWATEVGLVPNDSSLFKVFGPLITCPIPVNNCHIISSFFCDKMVIFAIFRPKIHLVSLISQQLIELHSWDWSSQMKALIIFSIPVNNCHISSCLRHDVLFCHFPT